MAVFCEKCNHRCANRAAMYRHVEKKHPTFWKRVSGTGTGIIPFPVPSARPQTPQARPRPVLDVLLESAEIVRAPRPQARPLRILVSSEDGPPAWWEPNGEETWRREAWELLAPDYRRQLLAQRAGVAFSIRSPDTEDSVTLWSQYRALQAFAIRLDAGVGTERERVAFEAGLLEYNSNFERIRAQRKALPG